MDSKAVRHTFGDDNEDTKPHTVIYKSCNGSTKVSFELSFKRWLARTFGKK